MTAGQLEIDDEYSNYLLDLVWTGEIQQQYSEINKYSTSRLKKKIKKIVGTGKRWQLDSGKLMISTAPLDFRN